MIKDNRKRYRIERYKQNNKTLLMMATFLWIEQLVYGFLFTTPNTMISETHLVTAGISFIYFLILGYMYLENKKGINVSIIKEVIQFSFVAFGLGVAIFRAVYISGSAFSVPVIYIAVLYGSAFVFYFPSIWRFILYALGVASFIGLGLMVNEGLLYETLIQDIITNNLLAWLASVLAYKRFTKEVDSMVRIEEQNAELVRLSNTDSLTQIYNRRYLDLRLIELHEEAMLSKTPYAIIMVDIDYFKNINDQFGHVKGDQVLIEVTNILNSLLNHDHIFGRWGGEEFMIICKKSTVEEAAQLAEALKVLFNKAYFKVGCQITCSFGVSAFAYNTSFVDTVLKADKALYKSKDNGRNQVTVEV